LAGVRLPKAGYLFGPEAKLVLGAVGAVAAVVALGLGKTLLDGFCGVVAAMAVMDGFFLPQLSQFMLGELKPLLHPDKLNNIPVTVNPTNIRRIRKVCMAHSPFVRRAEKRFG
jgi:hypothetical protein